MVSPDPAPAQGSAWLSGAAGWLLFGVIGVGFLFLAAANAPQRTKLPVITPLALGAIAGWGLGALAAAHRPLPVAFVALASAGIIVGGGVAREIETWRRELPALRRQIEQQLQHHEIAGRMDESFLDPNMKTTPNDADDSPPDRDAIERARALRQAERARFDRMVTFPGYLENRIPRAWGRWAAPWPELFWGAEIALSSALGAMIALRLARPRRVLPE